VATKTVSAIATATQRTVIVFVFAGGAPTKQLDAEVRVAGVPVQQHQKAQNNAVIICVRNITLGQLVEVIITYSGSGAGVGGTLQLLTPADTMPAGP
jgi:hypothetical protein